MAKWIPVKLEKLYTNVQESILSKGGAAIENCYSNEMGGFTAFPGLKSFSTLSGNAPTYLHEWRGDLVAVTSGRFYRISQDGTAGDVTKVPIAGDGRVVFDRTEDELIAAAGGQIIRFAGGQTEVLSETAPLSTHAGFIDGYVVAIERDSGRFYHSGAGAYREWDPIDVFSAEGKPDNLNSLLITPFRELILTGLDSIEQFERLPSGDTPFFRRWAVGEGVLAPYTLIAADNGMFAVNRDKEFVRMSGQTSGAASDDIGQSLESIDNWDGAWAARANMVGQKFIFLQMPKATNEYGTEGITFLYDYRNRRWYSLFGWDESAGIPSRWPGWSYYTLWGRHFVGGNGQVWELDKNARTNVGARRRILGRTAHIGMSSPFRVDDVRLIVKRGVAGHDSENPIIRLRAKRDNQTWTRWKEKTLGRIGSNQQELRFGPMGDCDTIQFEWEITQGAEVEISSLDFLATGLER
ncbi:MAG: hypothetical protein EG825_00445 [Rhodocyclaceae bacterium]|nr:hypothetical protein [Rhodocyclaceae bacterium]